jgi:hypothetical protein
MHFLKQCRDTAMSPGESIADHSPCTWRITQRSTLVPKARFPGLVSSLSDARVPAVKRRLGRLGGSFSNIVAAGSAKIAAGSGPRPISAN